MSQNHSWITSLETHSKRFEFMCHQPISPPEFMAHQIIFSDFKSIWDDIWVMISCLVLESSRPRGNSHDQNPPVSRVSTGCIRYCWCFGLQHKSQAFRRGSAWHLRNIRRCDQARLQRNGSLGVVYERHNKHEIPAKDSRDMIWYAVQCTYSNIWTAQGGGGSFQP